MTAAGIYDTIADDLTIPSSHSLLSIFTDVLSPEPVSKPWECDASVLGSLNYSSADMCSVHTTKIWWKFQTNDVNMLTTATVRGEFVTVSGCNRAIMFDRVQMCCHLPGNKAGSIRCFWLAILYHIISQYFFSVISLSIVSLENHPLPSSELYYCP